MGQNLYSWQEMAGGGDNRYVTVNESKVLARLNEYNTGAFNQYASSGMKATDAWIDSGYGRKTLGAVQKAYATDRKWYSAAKEEVDAMRSYITSHYPIEGTMDNPNANAPRIALNMFDQRSRSAMDTMNFWQGAVNDWDKVYKDDDARNAKIKTDSDDAAAQYASEFAKQDALMDSMAASHRQSMDAQTALANKSHNDLMALRAAETKRIKKLEYERRMNLNYDAIRGMDKKNKSSLLMKNSKGVNRFQVNLNTSLTMSGSGVGGLGVPE